MTRFGDPDSAPRDRDPVAVDKALAMIDPCRLIDPAAIEKAGFVAGTLRPRQPDSCAAFIRHYAIDEVSVEVGADFRASARYASLPEVVGGYRAYLADVTYSEVVAECVIDFPVSFTRSIQLRVELEANGPAAACTVARALQESAVTLAVAAAGPTLLYRPEEPDQAAIGACVHWLSAGTTEGCRPHLPTMFPDDPSQLLAGDADVSCAATIDTVRRFLGDTMKPIVYGEHCVFVEPTHELQFSVAMSDLYVPDHYGINPTDPTDVEDGRTTTVVAGHPAIAIDHTADPMWPRYELFISPGDDVLAKGVVQGRISAEAPRGSHPDTPPNTQKLDLIQPIMADIMNRYFSVD